MIKARTKTEAAYLLSERRKDEMLRECYRVFRSLTSLEATRNKAREMGIKQVGGRQRDEMLASFMMIKLKQEGFGDDA